MTKAQIEQRLAEILVEGVTLSFFDGQFILCDDVDRAQRDELQVVIFAWEEIRRRRLMRACCQ